MPTDSVEIAWMNEHCLLTLAELSALSGLPDSMLVELVECGALVPVNPDEVQWTFSARCAVTVRKAGRLREDFDLDSNALAVAMSLLERVRDLEEQLHAAYAQIPRRIL